jgi:sensor c-di-GMP phosphodiesterase-like protein
LKTLVKPAWLVALFLGGTLAGTGLALQVAWRLQLRSGEYALLRYAHSLLHVLETASVEAGHVGTSMTADKLPSCSDEELALMRRLVYDATFVRDIGRVKDGLLYCTASLGRLPHPVKEPVPDLSFQQPDMVSSIEIASSRKLTFAPGPAGIVVVSQGVSEVLNPSLFERLDDPPMQFTGLFFDHEHQVVLYGAGHIEALPAADVLAQKVVRHGDIIYQPLCSSRYPVCVIGSEPVSAMVARRSGILVACTTGGALLGLSLTSTILLLFRRQRSFEHRLRRAIRSRRLFCVYQPIVSLDTREVVGAEALVRWTNEMGEPVSPESFIPVAEAKGYVGEITRLVMDRVIEDLGPVLAAPEFKVTINITAQDLADPEFFGHLTRLISKSSIAPEALAFELTERSRTDGDVAKQGIARLRAAGHRVYIDDFGTGYSSLAYLHSLRVDAIKIDRVFTQTVGTESVIGVVLPQIVYMASRLGLIVVAEGVETEEQADYFCHAVSGILGQGHFFGTPVPAAEFKRLFAPWALSGSLHNGAEEVARR